MNAVLQLLSNYTVQNVAAGAALLGVASGVLGCFAVLRRQSLLGDALSHAALPGICLGFIVAGSRHLPSLLAGALASGLLATLVMLLLARVSRLKTDAILGITLSVFFAVGVVLLTGIQNSGAAGQGGLDSFLFGQAAAILRSDLAVLGVLAGAGLLAVVAWFKEFKLVTFDPVYAATQGVRVTLIETALTMLVAVAVVVGLQLVGVVLMSAMLIAPAVAARQWVNRLEHMLVLAGVFGAAAGVTGALISTARRGLSTGPVVVLIIVGIAVASILFAPGRGVLWEAIFRWRTSRRLRSHQLLTTMLRLGQEHGDPAYATETGMLNAYTGVGTAAVLRDLARRGLVEPRQHMPEEGLHWALTDAGRAAAERVLRDLGRRDTR